MAGQATGSTYGNDPANSPLDHVRLLVGDTVCSTAYLKDAEILFLIQEEGSAAHAAPRAAEAIAAQLSRKVDTKTGGVSKSLSQLAKAYLDLAKTLRARADELVAPVATGISKAEKQTDAADADLVQPFFRRKLDDNPRTGADVDEELWPYVP